MVAVIWAMVYNPCMAEHMGHNDRRSGYEILKKIGGIKSGAENYRKTGIQDIFLHLQTHQPVRNVIKIFDKSFCNKEM